MVRIADEAIVTFSNFADYHVWMTQACRGRLPVSNALPFEQEDLPNIHRITLKGFRGLCDREGFEIREVPAGLFLEIRFAAGRENAPEMFWCKSAIQSCICTKRNGILCAANKKRVNR